MWQHVRLGNVHCKKPQPFKKTIMTKLAETLGKIIRERGGFLPSHDNWLEDKANEIRKLVYREIFTDIRNDLETLEYEIGCELTHREIQSVIEDKFLELEAHL